MAGPSPGPAGEPEALPAAGDPALRATDLYAFASPDRPGTVTLIADWLPFERSIAGPDLPAFRPGARYDINVDSDGDARPDVTYRWVFSDVAGGAAAGGQAAPGGGERDGRSAPATGGPGGGLDGPAPAVKQTYTLTEIRNGRSTTLLRDAVAAPRDAGRASMPDYPALRRQAVRALKGGGQVFAGPADDPSFLDPRVFDPPGGGARSGRGHDSLAGDNVLSIVLQVPAPEVAENGDPAKNPVIGVWSSASRQDRQPGPAGPDESAPAAAGMGKAGTAKADPANADPASAGGAEAGGAAHAGAVQAGGPGQAGGPAQVSRVGNPLVGQVIAGSDAAGFTARTPDRDGQDKAFIAEITDPDLPRLFRSAYRVPAPPAPRNDLVEIFLTGVAKDAPTLDGTAAPIRTDLNSQILNQQAQRSAFVPAEELRLNMSVPVTARPERLGALAGDDQGFPNGRRLADDVVDIELRLLEGAALTGTPVPRPAAGDGVNANDVPFDNTFPYLALPHPPAG